MASALSISLPLSPLLSSTINSSPSSSLSYPSLSLLPSTHFTSSAIRIQASSRGLTSTDSSSPLYPLWSNTRNPNKLICRAAEYKFPDPIPEFAQEETEKFRTHLLTKLSKKDIYGDSIEEVIGICTEIFSTFLHTEYGGSGTLLVVPFIDMADTLNERGLPGGPQAARAAVKWAQKHVDKDWKEWTSNGDH